MNTLEVRAALALAAVYVLRMLGLFMVMPVLAVAAMDYPDYSPVWVGIAVGGYGLTQAALQIPMGMLSDRWGRKPVILLGLLVFAIGSLVAAQASSLHWLIVGRILQGAGAIAGAIMALAADVSRESQRAKVMAIIGVAIGLSFYVAVIVGPLLAEQWGLSGIFLITGVLAVLALPLVKWVVPDSPLSAAQGETLPQRGQLARLVKSSQLWRLNVSVLLLHMFITLLFVQLPLTLLHFDMTLASHWTLYLPVLAISVLLMALMMGAARGRIPKPFVVVCVMMMLLAFVLLGTVSQHWWLMIAAVVLFFTGFNYLEASFPALVSSIAPAGRKGTAMGIYASFQFFGAFLGGLLSGIVTDWLTAEAAYLAGAAFGLLWLWVIAGLRETRRVRRVLLQAQFSPQQTTSLQQRFDALPGVEESRLDSQRGLVYLKVTGEFDQYAAEQLLAE